VGILEETWWQTGNKKIAQANAVIHEAITESFESLVAQRLSASEDLESFPIDLGEPAELSPFEAEKLQKTRRRDAVKKLMQDGFWLAMSHRALLAKILGAKMLGIGGLTIAGLALTPTVIETFQQRFHPRKGILQGSPMSPVLANLYLTDFDEKFTRNEFQLVRYCDDFVILCRTEAEASKALQTARRELGKRNLKLHAGKTRILSPTDEFEFLGYRFLSNGMIQPPLTATGEMARKLKAMSKNVAAKFHRQDRKFKVERIKIKSWKEYFEIFGKKD